MDKKKKVMCTYCQSIVEVDKSTADQLDGTTAFCCKECLNANVTTKTKTLTGGMFTGSVY